MATVTELKVDGIDGADDVARVQGALRAKQDVRDVLVELSAEGPARVTVVTQDLLDVAALRHAASNAGFTVVDVSVTRDAEAVAFAAQAHAMQSAHTQAAHVAD